MEKVPAPSPRKKPHKNPGAKPGGAQRKPSATAKPAAKKPTPARKPGTSAKSVAEETPPVAEAVAGTVAKTVEESNENVTVTETPKAPEAPEAPEEADRPGSGWLSIPKLSLPKLSLGRAMTTTVIAPTTEPKPKTTSDPVPDETPATEPAVQPETVPEPEPEPAPEPEPEPEPEPKSAVLERVTNTVAVREAKSVARRAPRKRGSSVEIMLKVEGLTKQFDDTIAVNDIDLEVMAGSFYGIVGPNGAGKTTTLSMITGLLRPTAGTISVHGADVWTDPVVAKRNMGVLPDRLRLFDRLTGAQLLYYAGVLRGMDRATVQARAADLAAVFGLEESLPRLVSDYSAGMTKKVALAAAMIHSPRLLVLDEPFESVDPVSAATVTEILKAYVAGGGTVVLSSHSMDLVQRICDFVAVVVDGSVLADGTMDDVRGGGSLEERFIELAGGHQAVEGLEWLSSFSD